MKSLLLIDAHSLIHRCYHAVPPLTNERGEPVGALFGVSNVLLKILSQREVDYVAALFDRPEPTFRKQKFAEYKINRPKAEDALVFQLQESLELFRSFGITTFEKPGYEGDDLIGTLAETFRKNKEIHTTILTGDMDSLQLVDDTNHIEVETFKKGITDIVIYHEKEVFERLGVEPDQVVDYKALVGDTSDNIPGVPGVGPKTASGILQKYKTLKNYFKNGIKEKTYEKISIHKQVALLSQELARIDTHVPIKTSLEDIIYKPNTEKLVAFFQKHNFVSLLKRVENKNNQINKPTNTDTTQTKKQAGDDSVGNRKLKIENSEFIFKPIQIALQLLGFSLASWEEYTQTIYKHPMTYNEFIQTITPWISKKISENNLIYVYNSIELPLIPIIDFMQKNGVLIDSDHLKNLESVLQKEIDTQEKILQEKTECVINFNSPKQVLDLLKEIPGLKIKSTSADTLEKIKNKIPWVADLLVYREFFKLQTTYVVALQKLVEKDGRIHPTFLQLGAATGRLSCQNPNLQNIPQESRWSQDIRNAFVSPQNYSLVAIDYSQIELRVLASLAQDKNMIQAFQNGEDIHTLTAQKIFGKPAHHITKQMRRSAKTLNFGMVYGMGYRALAQQAGINQEEAKQFINKYFEEFSSIKLWHEHVLRDARKTAKVTSATGRIRLLPEIHSTNGFFSSQAEREAINMPVQGLAADILKLAMIRVNAFLHTNKLNTAVRMILTIHDELIFEIADGLLVGGTQSDIIKNLQHEMESALPINPNTGKTPIIVPIKTEVSIGKKWGELK